MSAMDKKKVMQHRDRSIRNILHINLHIGKPVTIAFDY